MASLTDIVTVPTPTSRYGKVLASTDPDGGGRSLGVKETDVHVDTRGGGCRNLLISREGPAVGIDGHFSDQTASTGEPLYRYSLVCILADD